ncbi:MAG: hypothetical protein ACJ748_11090, partial [Flavisolibacter sp.]
FMASGGMLRIHIDPNGHDTWKIRNLVLTLSFSDGLSKTIAFGPAIVSQDSKEYSYYFDSQFNPK